MNTMEKVRNVKINSPLLSGLIYSFMGLFMLTLLVSLLLMLTNLTETSMLLYIYIIHGITLLIGGFMSGKRAGEKGWYHGGIVGFVYSVIIILIGFLGFDTALLSLESLLFMVLSFVAAAIGGIFGVNMSR